MPAAARSIPRMMFPPPTTIASSMPDRWTSAISSASDSMRSWSMPNSRSPESASPESFSSARLKAVAGALAGVGLAVTRLLCHGEALELEHLELRLVEHLADPSARVVDPRLLLEHDLREPLLDPAFDDLLADLLGLRLHVGLLREDVALGVDLCPGDVRSARVQGPGGGNVHCQPIGLVTVAASVHQHPQLVRRRMDVGGEDVPVLTLVADGVADDDVLAQLGDQLGALLFEL